MLSLLLLACTGAAPADTADPCADTPAVTWSSWGQGFFRTYCTSCHSVGAVDRAGAPDAVNFDTVDDVRTYEAAVRRTVLETGTMPVGGGVPDDDAYLLDVFLRCGL
ncbi:MAG: hypothetical protein ACK4YP_00240 [Myxococcota bacterium]